MKTRLSLRMGLAGLLAVLVPAAQAAPIVDFGFGKAAVGADLNLGGQKAAISGTREKFNEYRDVRDGFLVNELGFAAAGETIPYYLDFRAVNATREDERYDIKGGRYGKFKAFASFDRTPHNFGSGRLVTSGAGTGVLGISNAVQQGLQAVEQTRAERGGVPTVDTTGEDQLQRSIIQDLIANTKELSFGLDRETSKLGLEFNVGRDGKTWVKASDERRNGIRSIGNGSYERYSQGAAGIGHTSDMFFVTGQEMAEPVHYRTTSMNAGFGVYKKAWSADLEYTYTEFANQFEGLRWANPFRATDATATSNADVATSNPFNRGRFAQGQMALAPDNRSHDVAASGSVELPWNSRLTGSVGMGVNEQTTELLPFTLNSAMAGVGSAPVDVFNTASLPVKRFHGEVRNITGSLVLSSKPTDRLSTKLKYRFYDYDNRSDVITFPGYAAFGESFWRTVKNDKNLRVFNEPLSYTRQTTELGGEYEVAHPVTLSADTFYDRWSFVNARVGKTGEVGAGVGFAAHPGRVVKVHGGYKFARRATEDYKRGSTAQNPEAFGLVNYNWADRKRHRANLGVGVTPSDTVSFDVTGAYQTDAYGVNERFGLKSQKNLSAGFDGSYEPSEKVAFTFGYSRERRESKMQNAAKDDAFDTAVGIDDEWAADNFNPLNYWNDRIVEDIDTISFDTTLRPTEKTEFGVGYALSYGEMSFNQSNPNQGDAVAAGYAAGAKLANGVAQLWPKVINRTHEVRVGAAYKLLENVKVGLSYLFEDYALEDFSNTGAYLAGQTPENTTRYIWTGATQRSYAAHVLGTYVAMKF